MMNSDMRLSAIRIRTSIQDPITARHPPARKPLIYRHSGFPAARPIASLALPPYPYSPYPYPSYPYPSYPYPPYPYPPIHMPPLTKMLVGAASARGWKSCREKKGACRAYNRPPTLAQPAQT